MVRKQDQIAEPPPGLKTFCAAADDLATPFETTS
jgi:hypothetical protein